MDTGHLDTFPMKMSKCPKSSCYKYLSGGVTIVWLLGYSDTYRVVTTPPLLEAYLASKGYQCSIVWGYNDTHIYQYDYT